MALPRDEYIQYELLRFLATAPNGRMHCRDVYNTCAKQFPGLVY